MLARRIFVLLIATILVGRTLHCCYTNAVLCAGVQQADESTSLPLRNPNDFDPNETGCICKGAIVSTPSLLQGVRASVDELSPFANSLLPANLAIPVSLVQARPADRHLLGPPPLGGRALRAWIGSLLV